MSRRAGTMEGLSYTFLVSGHSSMLQSRRYPGLRIRGEGRDTTRARGRGTLKIQYMVNGNGLMLHKTGHERGGNMI